MNSNCFDYFVVVKSFDLKLLISFVVKIECEWADVIITFSSLIMKLNIDERVPSSFFSNLRKRKRNGKCFHLRLVANNRNRRSFSLIITQKSKEKDENLNEISFGLTSSNERPLFIATPADSHSARVEIHIKQRHEQLNGNTLFVLIAWQHKEREK